MAGLDLAILAATLISLCGAVTFYVARSRALAHPLLAKWRAGAPVRLSAEETLRLRQARSLSVLASTVALLVVLAYFVLAPAIAYLRAEVRVILMSLVMGSLAYAGWLWFRPRCPRCGLTLGFHAAPRLPDRCERCLVPFDGLRHWDS
jgi:hypothetical protein